ncbi:MAG: ribonuclease HI [Elusimicrobia bacterium]|nr:ribonuclease HI [Elusimicrobiota bacterium]MDE2426019.1 ribonuclease HI [Elusimicrobiota bacterium]
MIFTDGACSGNPGPGGWGAIVALPEGRVRELGGGEERTTNNRMELGAAIGALEWVRSRPQPALLCSDSTYLLSGITRWVAGWKRRGWLSSAGEPVLNRDLWERLDRLALERRDRLSWRHVRGHAGHRGNERCDEIAVAFARSKPVALYDGPASRYPSPLTPPSASGERRGPAVYLSLVAGRLERHATWNECSARVRGVKGARFKKVCGAQEEEFTLKAWGLR